MRRQHCWFFEQMSRHFLLSHCLSFSETRYCPLAHPPTHHTHTATAQGFWDSHGLRALLYSELVAFILLFGAAVQQYSKMIGVNSVQGTSKVQMRGCSLVKYGRDELMRRQPQHHSKSLKVSNSSEFPSEKQKKDKLKDKVKKLFIL